MWVGASDKNVVPTAVLILLIGAALEEMRSCRWYSSIAAMEVTDLPSRNVEEGLFRASFEL